MNTTLRSLPAGLHEKHRGRPLPAPQAANRLDENAERRRQLRWPVFWSATLSDGVQSHDCVVMDFSPSGARVKLQNPRRFDHSMAFLSFGNGVQLPGTLAWQRGGICGIAFSTEQPQAEDLAKQHLAA